MELNDDLKKIKKDYGERFMHLCRELFPTILEQPGLLSKIISENFYPNEFLYDDIINDNSNNNDNYYRNIKYSFKEYIYSKIGIEVEELSCNGKTPAELLKEAGYTLYECKSIADIQKFLKYYARGEELCTFKDNRLARCYVFFAVKDNVRKIKRENFKNPKRQDEYGTSVISIQFTKDGSYTLSIKNRYNHAVNNPDATFSNNLDNIIPGLTDAFNKTYNYEIIPEKGEFELPNYVKAKDGRLYKYNYERNNIYFCPNNIIIKDFKPYQYDKEKYILMDHFILDKRKDHQCIIAHKDIKIKDSFLETIGQINKIEETVDKETKNRTITINGNIEIVLDRCNQIYSYSNPNVEIIGDNFLIYNLGLYNIDLPNIKEIGDFFMVCNSNLIDNISFPKLERIGSNFLICSRVLNIDFPNVQRIRDIFLRSNNQIAKLNLPNVEVINDLFLIENRVITEVNMPKLRRIGDNFLEEVEKLEYLSLPSVEEIGSDFVDGNIIDGVFCHLKVLDLPNVKKIGTRFLTRNISLKSINVPKLKGSMFANILIGNWSTLKTVNGKPFSGFDYHLKERNIK